MSRFRHFSSVHKYATGWTLGGILTTHPAGLTHTGQSSFSLLRIQILSTSYFCFQVYYFNLPGSQCRFARSKGPKLITFCNNFQTRKFEMVFAQCLTLKEPYGIFFSSSTNSSIRRRGINHRPTTFNRRTNGQRVKVLFAYQLHVLSLF